MSDLGMLDGLFLSPSSRKGNKISEHRVTVIMIRVSFNKAAGFLYLETNIIIGLPDPSR
jgi:hypothetical protein